MLEVKNLSTYYFLEDKIIKAVRDVSFFVKDGESLGIVGESGSGKSTIGLSILRLISPPGKIVSGNIFWNGVDILKLNEKELEKIRGGEIGIIFQNPFTSLNPLFTIGEQIAEAVRIHKNLKGKDAWNKAVELLDLVHIENPNTRAKEYPHQWSGGMKQRAMLAMALAGNPKLLIADEPTTALDVTIQAQILSLIKEIKNKFNLSIIFITHNFAIVANMCDRIIVMKNGSIVEESKTEEIFKNPKENYTKKLLEAIPKRKFFTV